MASTDTTLADLPQELPRLWDFLDDYCQRLLQKTSPELRRQAQERITCIKFDRGPFMSIDISWLVKGRWNQLRALQLELAPEDVAQLSHGAWLLLTRLSLERARTWRLPPKAIAEPDFASFKGKWPLLEHLAIVGLASLNKAQIAALTDVKWTSLETLRIEPQDSALPHLLKSDWSELTELSIGSGLSHEGLRHISNCPWSALIHLQLVDCQVTPDSMKAILKAYLPQLKQLSFNRFWPSENAVPSFNGCFALSRQLA